MTLGARRSLGGACRWPAAASGLSRRLVSLVQKVAMRWPSGASTVEVSVLDSADEPVEVQAAQVVSHLAVP